MIFIQLQLDQYNTVVKSASLSKIDPSSAPS